MSISLTIIKKYIVKFIHLFVRYTETHEHRFYKVDFIKKSTIKIATLNSKVFI